MDESRPLFPLADNEIAYLKSIEAFLRGRVAIEQQTILGLQALLEGAPALPERKLSWHSAFEKLLGGTQEELQTRMEELETLEGRVDAVGASIAKAETFLRGLNLEFKNLKSADIVNSVVSAQDATATLYKDWQDTKVAEVIPQSRLSNFLSSGNTQLKKLASQKAKKKESEEAALKLYFNQDLIYRRTVYNHRQSQNHFLNSIPHRVQKYGTEYWTVVSDLGLLMESLANYFRNVSSTCNSAGSALWALTKNMKPLVDANCHTEDIEFANERSPIQFSPISYNNPGYNSRHPAGQTILFGCRPELRIDWEQKKAPLILEYLLLGVDSANYDQRHLCDSDCWAIVNEIEQAWTGVEELDRDSVSKWDRVTRLRLVQVYLRTLPEPVVSYEELEDIGDPLYESLQSMWNSWSQDPIKETTLQALFIHCGLTVFLACALCQRGDMRASNDALLYQLPSLIILYQLFYLRGIWSSPISDVQGDGTSSSSYVTVPEGSTIVGPGGA